MQQRIAYLHIGMHKTATSSIQRCFYNFNDGRVRYAALRAPNHSEIIHTIFAEAPERHPIHVRNGRDTTEVRRLREVWRQWFEHELKAPESVRVFSGEDMVRFTPNELSDLKSSLEQHFDQIKILAYVREPLGFASSAFQQRIQSGRTMFGIDKPDYRRRFEKFLEIFEQENVVFRPFRTSAFTNGCIITDFCEQIGVDASRIKPVRTNESLSTEAVSLLLQWNRFGTKSTGAPLLVRTRLMLFAILQQTFPGKFAWAADVVAKESDYEDHRWMTEQSGIDLSFDVEPAGVGIASESELLTIADQTVPALVEILHKRKIPLPDSLEPVDLLDEIFSDLLVGGRSIFTRFLRNWQFFTRARSLN